MFVVLLVIPELQEFLEFWVELVVDVVGEVELYQLAQIRTIQRSCQRIASAEQSDNIEKGPQPESALGLN